MLGFKLMVKQLPIFKYASVMHLRLRPAISQDTDVSERWDFQFRAKGEEFTIVSSFRTHICGHVDLSAVTDSNKREP